MLRDTFALFSNQCFLYNLKIFIKNINNKQINETLGPKSGIKIWKCKWEIFRTNHK